MPSAVVASLSSPCSSTKFLHVLTITIIVNIINNIISLTNIVLVIDDDDNDDDDVDDEDGETKWATKFKVGRGCKECISSTAFS